MLLSAIWLRVLPLVLVLAGGGLHPYYVSIYQINYSQEEQALQITAKLFTDDLESALQSHGAPELHLGTDREHSSADSLIAAYLHKYIKIQVDGAPVQLNYLGKEVELDQVTWCYLEIVDIPAFESVKVHNTALFEVAESQTNMVHVQLGETTKTMLLRRSTPQSEVFFP